METKETNEPCVYNADEIFNFENEFTSEPCIDWQPIDGETKSYIEIDNGQEYGRDSSGNKKRLYIEKADGYSDIYPFILAINGDIGEIIDKIAKEKNVYPDIDNVIEGYSPNIDYSDSLTDDLDVKALIGFEKEGDVDKFIIDTFDKRLYDRAFNQLIEKDVFMDNQTLENLVVNYVDPTWKNKNGKCAFDYDTREAKYLKELYKNNDWEIPVTVQKSDAPAKEMEKPHYTVQRIPFGKWMARSENADMRPMIDTLKGYMEIPLYVYTIPGITKEHNGEAVAISINSHPGRNALAVFSMCNIKNAYTNEKGILQTIYREHTIDCTTFKSAEEKALHHVLSFVGIDEQRNKEQYTVETEQYKSNKDLLNAYTKIAKAYMTRSPDNSLMDMFASSGNALSHFSQSEQKQLKETLKTLGVNNPERLGKMLTHTVNSTEKKRNKTKNAGYER